MGHYDVAVIGSGFGGSVSALRLTEKGYRVAVFEAGERKRPADFPTSNWDLRRYLWFPRLGLRGIQRVVLLPEVMVLAGAGVGGGSLNYANVMYRPPERFYHDRQWGGITDWEDELAPHYDRASRMLGVEENPEETPADRVMQGVAERMGVGRSYRRTPVAVYFGRPGEEAPDPYFGGLGPARKGCIRCGSCMIGCRHNAKNTLDKNYLYLAEHAGAEVHPEHEVTDVQPMAGGGFRVLTRRPGWGKEAPETHTADQVVFSAGVIGTLKLLFRLRAMGRLPNLSDRVGHLARTNSEALVGASSRSTGTDYSTGVAITSSIHPDDFTHIQPVRYPKGSNVAGLLSSVLTDGGGRIPRQLRFLGQVLTHPVAFLRTLSVHRWSERSIILLVMQSRDNSIRIRRSRFGFLTSDQGPGEPNPTYIPQANEAARHTADLIDGYPTSSLNEVLLDIPTTAHILGGAVIGATPETGVIDPYQRLFGHPGMHVVDASAIPANLGTNPSLTIAALAERAMSLWPNKGEPDLRPPLGEAYARLDPVAPAHPVVTTEVPDRGPA